VQDLAHTRLEAAPAARPRFIGAGMIAATVVVVALAGVASVLASSTAMSLFGIVVASAVYLALATAGMTWAERRDPDKAAVVLLAQVPLVIAVLALSDGRAFLIAMPLVSTAVLFLRLSSALALVAALIASFAAIVAREHSVAVSLQACVGFASAAAFVVVFSRLMRRERTARVEVERLLGDLRRANDQLAEYVTQVEELATTKERNRIAREVHDGLGHTLTVATVQLEAARTQVGNATVGARLERVQQILREGLGELRRSVSMLRVSPSSPQAFAKAIAELVEGSSESGPPVRWVTEGAPRPLPGAVGFTLYRAAQEALTNARRHAGARTVTVHLVYTKEKVVLRVEDDGEGAGTLTLGNGLAGLRERVALVGGTVAIDTARGEGMRVEVEVPA